MNLSPEMLRTFARLTVLVGGGVMIQLAVITQFRIFGVVPDIIPVLVVSLGLLGGATMGATTGFIAGFLIDLILIQTMGVSSLLLTIGGYSAGMLRELRDPVHPLTNSAVGAAAAVFFTVGFGIVQFSLGQPAPEFWSILWTTLLSGVYGALMAPLIFRAARWALLPTLGRDDPVRRRRRATLSTGSVLASPTINQRSRRRAARQRRKLS